MDQSAKKGLLPKDLLKNNSVFILAVAMPAAFCELFFALRETIHWIEPHFKGSFFLSDPRIHLVFEGLLRGSWLMLLILFLHWNRGRLQRAGRQVLFFTIGIATVLFLISLATIIAWLTGLKMTPLWMARYRLVDVTMLLLWGLSILFLLSTSSLKAGWSFRKWTYALALGGAFFYFLLKGLIWLQMLSGQFRLSGPVFRLLFLLLPLLILLGRLALIRLFSAGLESGDTAAER